VLSVEEGTGPRFPSPLRNAADFERLRDPEPQEHLGYVLEAIKLAQRALEGRVPLIGFAGAPWTLMSYMVEGQGSKSFSVAKRLLVEDPARAHALLDRLARAVGQFLKSQVRAGAQAVQIFDSWAGALGPRDFREFALPYLATAVRIAKEAGAPVIAFAPGAGWALEEIAIATGAEVIGIDWQTEAAQARRRLLDHKAALQGNLDPAWLYAPPEEIRARTTKMLEAFGGRGHIVNLGHGILPDVPVEHARAFVDAVKEWRP
jgi:uroporphyrinogen decarboxylase